MRVPIKPGSGHEYACNKGRPLMGQGTMLADSTGIIQANRGEWIRTK